MEETLQTEKPELEYKNQDDNQGGIRRRLRDRDLLRKRKAEAEEKETNQEESRRKRPRGEDKSSMGKRGRPSKTQPRPEVPVAPEEPAVLLLEAPGVPAQTLSTLIPLLPVGGEPLEVQPAYVPSGPAPLPVLSPTITPSPSSAPAPAITVPALVSVSVPVPAQTPDQAAALRPDVAPALVPDQAAALAPDVAPTLGPDVAAAPTPDVAPALGPDVAPGPAPALSEAPVPALPPAFATFQVESLYSGPQAREVLDQAMIEDLGPDEEEDISSSQDKRADQDLPEEPSLNMPQQNKVFSIPTFDRPPPPPEYFPGNRF